MKNFHSRSLADILERAKEIKEHGTEVVGYNTATRVVNGKEVSIVGITKLWRNVVFIATTKDLAERFYSEISPAGAEDKAIFRDVIEEITPVVAEKRVVKLKKLKPSNNGQ